MSLLEQKKKGKYRTQNGVPFHGLVEDIKTHGMNFELLREISGLSRGRIKSLAKYYERRGLIRDLRRGPALQSTGTPSTDPGF